MACRFCERTLSGDGEVNNSLQTDTICGDCKFLLLEDLDTQTHDVRRRRLHRRRLPTYGSSESIENLLSQQFSQMINLASHSDLEQEYLPGDVDSNLRLLQPASIRSTPSSSRRWRRVISDTESDGFNSDSSYGESGSNVSFGAYRVSHGDSDTISFSADGGYSDASVDGHTSFYRDIFVQSMEKSEIDSDTDIDPMHAGAVQWDSDDDEAEDNEWEEVDAEEHAVGSPESGAHVNLSGQNYPFIRPIDYPEDEGIIHRRVREGGHIEIPGIVTSVEQSSDARYLSNPGDYLDAQDFEELLEHLAETDGSIQGAPPAAASSVNSLPLIVISDKHQKHDGLACAICKDILAIGTKANQLPCLHLYHPSCILPWLNARNSCPVCRYELPTDDIDYEQGKFNARSRIVIAEIQLHDNRDDNSSIITDASEVNEAQELGELSGIVSLPADVSRTSTSGERGRWLFLAAAPIVSLMGIAFVLCLGKPLTGGRCPIWQHSLRDQHAQHIQPSGSGLHNQKVRRWWFF